MRSPPKRRCSRRSAPAFGACASRDVEVVRDDNGRPVPRLSGRAAEVAEELGVIEMHLSLSFTHSPRSPRRSRSRRRIGRGKDEPRRPEAELAASFKEARAMLDEIEPANGRRRSEASATMGMKTTGGSRIPRSGEERDSRH